MDNLESKIEEQSEKIKPMVYSIIANTDIDDVMQDIRLSFFVAFPRFNGRCELSTYAYAIAKKIIAQYFRRKYKMIREYKAAKSVLIIKAEKGSDLPSLKKKKSFKPKHYTLSNSEKKVFKLVGEGMNNAEIGKILNITINTVRSHLKKIYDKFQYKERVKLALFSYKFFKEKTNGT